jgi:hypothetical protein
MTLNVGKELRNSPEERRSLLLRGGNLISRKGKSKVRPRIGHKDPQGEYSVSCTLCLASALEGMGGKRHSPSALPPGKKLGTHCIGGWVGPRAGLGGCGKSRPHRDSIPGPTSP